MSMRDEKQFEHPSYATVQFSRTHGGRRPLFGTPLREHYTRILLTVRRATRSHGLSYDRIMGDDTLVELEMSGAQFVELLTTMNIGTGVPATLRYTASDGQIEEPPSEATESELIQTGFEEGLENLDRFLADGYAEAETLFKKKALSKDDKKRLLWLLGKTRQEVKSNWPFVLESFREAAQRVVTHAKSEVDNFIATAVHLTGLKALREKSAAQLMDGDQDTIEIGDDHADD